MRILFGITGQLGYGGLVQQSVVLVKYLREFGCEVLPIVGLAPPHNDEMALEELDYYFEAFNIADYVLRDKPALIRWLLGWYARHQVSRSDPQRLKQTGPASSFTESLVEVDVKRLLEQLIYHPDQGDIEKVRRLRRRFRPDIDYACELSMATYFGLLEDIGIPLVAASQGYELCQRHGIDMVSVVKANESRIDAVISGSLANVRENIAHDLPFLLPKTHVIPYGVVRDDVFEMSEAEALQRTATYVRPSSDEFVILSLGRVDVEKGVDLALHAQRILLSEGVPARVRIVGDAVNGEHYRKVIEAKAAMMDLSACVDFIGFVESKADKVALLKTSNVLLATFIKSEPFGLVLCEAMAAGIPVVAPDNGAAPEILGWHGRPSGLLYRSQDTGRMADQLAYLYHHPPEARELGRQGVLAVEQQFNAKRMARDVLALFEDVVAQRRQRGAPRPLASPRMR